MFTLLGWNGHHNSGTAILVEFKGTMGCLADNRTPYPGEHVLSNNGR